MSDNPDQAIIIPAVGESVNTANIAEWHKNDNDFVKKGEALLTIETDKIATEIEANHSGTLHIITPADTEVPIGATVGTISPGEAPEEAKTTDTKQITTPDQPEDTNKKPNNTPEETKKPTTPTAPPPSQTKNIATEQNQASDLATEQKTDEDRSTRKRMSPIRRKIATALVNAQQTAAILTTFNEADMSAIMQMRREIQDDFVAQNDIKLGYMSFFVKATISALRSVPSVNSRLDGEDIVSHQYFDIGVAVSTPRGLVVPVIRNPDEKSFAEIEKDIASYAGRAQTGALDLKDLTGGVFTITNGGVFGSMLSTPIINPPQSAILGMHTIQQRPVAIDGKVVIRPMMYLALSYDHRIIDGREAVTFLNHIKAVIENPARLFLNN